MASPADARAAAIPPRRTESSVRGRASAGSRARHSVRGCHRVDDPARSSRRGAATDRTGGRGSSRRARRHAPSIRAGRAVTSCVAAATWLDVALGEGQRRARLRPRPARCRAGRGVTPSGRRRDQRRQGWRPDRAHGPRSRGVGEQRPASGRPWPSTPLGEEPLQLAEIEGEGDRLGLGVREATRDPSASRRRTPRASRARPGPPRSAACPRNNSSGGSRGQRGLDLVTWQGRRESRCAASRHARRRTSRCARLASSSTGTTGGHASRRSGELRLPRLPSVSSLGGAGAASIASCGAPADERELMLLVTILLWALNLERDEVHPRAGAATRCPTRPCATALAAVIFVGAGPLAERTLRSSGATSPCSRSRRHPVAEPASFVFALDVTTASTIGLLLDVIPIFAALFGVALGRDG